LLIRLKGTALEASVVDDTVTVPIGWLFAVAGALLVSFFWWLRTEWSRNWKEHESMKSSALLAHNDLNHRIDTHDEKIDRSLTRIHKRIDWLIQHQAIPDFPEDEDEDV